MLIRCVLSSFSKPYTICIWRSIHPESTEACGRTLIYVIVALESTEGFILAGMWDQFCNYSPLAGMPLLGLSYIRNRLSFLKLPKTMRSMEISSSCEEEACTISWRGNCIGAQVSTDGTWSLSPCIKNNALWLCLHPLVWEWFSRPHLKSICLNVDFTRKISHQTFTWCFALCLLQLAEL